MDEEEEEPVLILDEGDQITTTPVITTTTTIIVRVGPATVRILSNSITTINLRSSSSNSNNLRSRKGNLLHTPILRKPTIHLLVTRQMVENKSRSIMNPIEKMRVRLFKHL